MAIKRLTQSLGIETECGLFLPILMSGSNIPCQKNNFMFSPARSEQSNIDINIRQGECWEAVNDILLGKIEFTNLEKCHRGIPCVSINFYVNAEGRLLVYARNFKSNQLKHLSVMLNLEPVEKLSSEQIRQDEQFKLFTESRIFAQQMIDSYQELIDEIESNDEKSVISTIEKIRKNIGYVKEALNSNNDLEKLTQSMQELSEYLTELTFLISVNPKKKI